MIKINNGTDKLWCANVHLVKLMSAQKDTFGDRLRSERLRLKLSQDDFATIGGVKKRTQITYEQNERQPDTNYLQLIAEAGVDVLFTLLGDSAVAVTSPDEVELILGYRKLDVRGKAGVLAMVGGMTAPEDVAAKAVFHGDVGQVVRGNVTAPVNITIGGKKKKDKKEE